MAGAVERLTEITCTASLAARHGSEHHLGNSTEVNGTGSFDKLDETGWQDCERVSLTSTVGRLWRC
jgi:hypothetical protein